MPNLPGKRMKCSVCGAQVLIAKKGDGQIECDGQPMELIEAKALPSSD